MNWTPLIIAALLIGGLLVVTGQIPFTVTIDGKTCENKFLVPVLGRIECEPYPPNTMKNNDHYVNTWTEVICGDAENTRECEIWVKSKWSYWEIAPWAVYSVNGKSKIFVKLDTSDVFKKLTTVPVGSKVYVSLSNSGIYETIITRDFVVRERYQPWGLIVHDAGGKEVYSTQTCDLSALPGIYRDEILRDEYRQRLDYGDWVNYVAHWAQGPADLNLYQKDGSYVYCQLGGSIYEVEVLDVVDGCYFYPGSFIGKEDCCPGQKTASAYCGDDFKWHSKGEPSCFTVLECPGMGDWIPDYKTPEYDVVRYDCQEGNCIIVERKVTECTPPDIGCPEGYLCDARQGYKCVPQIGPNITCGDGVCSIPYEDAQNCPEDCKEGEESIWLFPVLIASLAGIFTIIKLKKEKTLGIIAGLLVAGVVWFVVDWLIRNWLLIALGGILTGGILIYLVGFTAFGAFILMALTVGRK
ncbi:MAG: hypothetical protein ACTSUF_05405 [Candidatus Heimdallarchaeaceae archaeon]